VYSGADIKKYLTDFGQIPRVALEASGRLKPPKFLPSVSSPLITGDDDSYEWRGHNGEELRGFQSPACPQGHPWDLSKIGIDL